MSANPMQWLDAAYSTLQQSVQAIAGAWQSDDGQPVSFIDWEAGSGTSGPANLGTPTTAGYRVNNNMSNNTAGPSASTKVRTLVFEAPQPSQPRIALQGWVNANFGGQPHRAFGEAGNDKYFAHTVTLPAGARIAGVRVALDITRNDNNDGLAVGVLPDGPRFGSRLHDLGIPNGQRRWVTIDLDRPHVSGQGSVLEGVAAAGLLDVAVQDDSTVHRMLVAVETQEA